MVFRMGSLMSSDTVASQLRSERSDGWSKGSWKLFRRLFQLALPALSVFANSSSLGLQNPPVNARTLVHAKLIRRFAGARDGGPATRRQRRLLSLELLEGSPSRDVTCTELTIPGPAGALAARLYRPKASPSSDNPLLVYFHFGGCVLGSLDSCHTACSLIAERSGFLVLSASYRLAPEHRFPAAVDDALAAFRWAKASAQYLGANPDLVSIGGDSAGGYLAAAVSLCLRDAQEALPCAQLLIYPVLEMDRRSMPTTPFDHCYPLTRDDMIWYCDQYMRDERDAEDPRCSVARASTLKGLPPTILAQAGYDLLFAEGEAFGQRLEADGVPLSRLIFPSLPHAFTAMSGGVQEARTAIMEIADAIKASVAHAREQEHQQPARSEA